MIRIRRCSSLDGRRWHRGGTVHGATDELGFHAAQDRHYGSDVHATILKLLGLDSRRLEVPGRKRLAIDHGTPSDAIIA